MRKRMRVRVRARVLLRVGRTIRVALSLHSVRGMDRLLMLARHRRGSTLKLALLVVELVYEMMMIRIRWRWIEVLVRTRGWRVYPGV